MISLILEMSLLVMAIGLIAKFILDKKESENRIDKNELIIASAVLLLIVIPLTAYVGTKAAISNNLTFNENWGGYEVSSQWIKSPCTKDGSMKHYYKGDPEKHVWYTTSKDSKGRTTRTRHEETIWHNIPYTTEEWTFVIHTTLGDFTIADRNLPSNPNNYRYRAFHSVPDDLPSGIPDFWTQADNRLRQNIHGPVTARREYKNYILASQSTILHKFSADIERYKKDGLLPDLNRQVIHDFYSSDRVFFVGTSVPGQWQTAVNKLDAALGSTLQGDLYLVVVDANKVLDPDNYTIAMTAYWESKEFDKDALSKNGIVVVLGTKDGQTVAWARARTGMPEGNEAMLLDIQNVLKGVRLTPETILGNPTPEFSGASYKVAHTQGALEKVLWGDHPFQRVHMEAHGKGSVGYTYLMRELEPTAGQRIAILLVGVLFGIIAWVICIVHGAPAFRSYRSRY